MSDLSIRAKIADLASDASLDPAERISQLRQMRESVKNPDLVGQIEGYIGSLELRREASAIERSVSMVALRENANIREYLIQTGQSTAEELSQIGYLSHEELDAREADGTLSEAIDLTIEEGRGVRDVLRWTKGFEKGGEFRPTRGGDAGRRVTKAMDGGREKGTRKADDAPTAKPSKPKVSGSATDPAPDAGSPKSPGIKERLAEVQAKGLNDWPTVEGVGLELLDGAKDTQELHTEPNPSSPGTGGAKPERIYKPERAKLHSKIMGEFIAGIDHEESAKQGKPVFRKGGLAELLGEDNPITLKVAREGVDSLTPEERTTIRKAAAEQRDGPKPAALFMAGGPASGKTSALRVSPELKPTAAVDINADDVKALFPEFAAQVAAGERAAASTVHEESSDVSKALIAEAADLGLNVVMDGTGNSSPGKFARKLREMADDGYVIDVLGVTIPTDDAVVRGYDRAMKTGRWVPEPEIRKSHAMVSANMPEVMEADWVRSVTLYDNSGGADDPPQLIGKGEAGQFAVADQALLDQFLEKAKDLPADLPDDTQAAEKPKESK